MTTDIIDQPVRLRSPADIVEAVPHLVGFQPEDSLVIIALRGKRGRLGVVARLDLAEIWQKPRRVALVLDFLQRDSASRALLVFYPPSGGRAHPAIAPTVDALTQHLEPAGISIDDVLCVCEGRWWSLRCDAPACCPPEGTPVDSSGASAMAMAAVVKGRATLGSRRELERTIEPLGGAVGAAMAYALPRARAELDDRVAAGESDTIAKESISLLTQAVEARLAADRSSAAMLTVDCAARLIVGLADVRVRDELLCWSEGEHGAATCALLVELAQHAVPPFGEAPLTVLAWIAYLRGEGALAGIAVDRMLAGGDVNGLVRILDQALRSGFNPSRFGAALRALRRPSSGG